MEINKNELISILTAAEKISADIELHIEGNQLLASSANDVMCYQSSTEIEKCDEECTFKLDKNVLTILKALKSNKESKLILKKDGDSIIIKNGSFKAKVKEPITSGVKFDIEKENDFTVAFNVGALKSILYAAAVDDSRPILKGINITFDEEKLYAVALDGYRADKITLDYKKIRGDISENVSITIDKDIMANIISVMDTEAVMIVSKKQCIFNSNGAIIACSLLEGDYIKFDSLIKQEKRTEILVNNMALREAIHRASILSGPIGFEVDGINKLLVKSETDALITEEIPINDIQDNVDIWFNSRYMIDVVSSISEETLKIEYRDSISPIYIIADNRMALVVPIRKVK